MQDSEFVILAALGILQLLLVTAVGAAIAYGLWKLWNILRRQYDIDGVIYREIRAGGDHTGKPDSWSHIEVGPVYAPPNRFSGLGRKDWIDVADQMLSGFLQHTDSLRSRPRIPESPLAGFPQIATHGGVFGESQGHLEAIARSLWVAAPLLNTDPALRHDGARIADYYRSMIVRGTIRHDETWFGAPSYGIPSPQVMEAAAICIALRQARVALWDPLSAAEKRRVTDWLRLCSGAATNHNNWRWFGVIVNTFLKTEGVEYREDVIARNLEDIRSMYAGSGWFRDGTRFDFYSSWSMQFYPVFWLLWDGDSYPVLRDEFLERNDQFLESFAHVFSRRGEIPLWGRSATYRFAAAASLTTAYLRPRNPRLDAGFARRLASGCMLQFIRHPSFLRNGVPSLGFLGEQRHVLDSYSGVPSPYWCAKIFTALYLQPGHAFWTEPETEGFWTSPPKRHEIEGTGMYVEHDAETGHSRLFATQEGSGSDWRYADECFDTKDASDC